MSGTERRAARAIAVRTAIALLLPVWLVGPWAWIVWALHDLNVRDADWVREALVSLYLLPAATGLIVLTLPERWVWRIPLGFLYLLVSFPLTNLTLVALADLGLTPF